MVDIAGPEHDHRMSEIEKLPSRSAQRGTDRPRLGDASPRGPGHSGRVLYEHAAALLATTRAFEAATHAPGAETTLGPTLACLEVSLEALAQASQRLSLRAAERLRGDAPDREGRAIGEHAALQLSQLAAALEESQLACAHTRASIGIALPALAAH